MNGANRPCTSLDELLERLRFLPHQVAWCDIRDFDRFDERFGLINSACGPIMDVTPGRVALSIDGEQTIAELLAWAWLIRPDLEPLIVEVATADFREAIKEYRSGK